MKYVVIIAMVFVFFLIPIPIHGQEIGFYENSVNL